MDKVGISVIIPAYNAEAYIGKCINSVLCQECADLEAIVIDDGSTDGTAQVCDDLAKSDERIKVHHIKNGGVSNARNTGLRYCTKPFVTFLDSDDYFAPHSFSQFLEDLREESIVTLWVYNYSKVYPDRVEPMPFMSGPIDKDKFINGMLMYNGTGGVAGKIFVSDIAKQCEFKREMKMGEDTRFVLDYLSKIKAPIYCSVYSIYNYVQLATSATHSKAYLKEFTTLNNEFIKYFSSQIMDSERSRALSYYVGTNILVKLEKGCYDFSHSEISYIKGHFCDCTSHYSTVNKWVAKIFSITPLLGYVIMQVIRGLRYLKYGH